MRIAIGIEYDGTAYNGWQRQENGAGVQECIERALSSVANEKVSVQGAGRTDAGVHASAQVAHFDSASQRSERGWLLGANSTLPDDISLSWVQPVSDEFHARFSATSRSYRYEILNRLVRPALERKRAWWIYQPLDARLMNDAAQLLVGTHDYSAFRAAECQAKSAQREIYEISVIRRGDRLTLDIRANAFLHRMVRNIIGSLVAVGLGEQRPAWIADVLASRDRKCGGIGAPAHGLTLVGVRYPDHFELPRV
jgi:tRNA pseudouridine38-40 synthase